MIFPQSPVCLGRPYSYKGYIMAIFIDMGGTETEVGSQSLDDDSGGMAGTSLTYSDQEHDTKMGQLGRHAESLKADETIGIGSKLINQ